MATNFYYAPSKNGIQKTLSSILLNTATAGDPISLSDVDGIQNKPGVLVINRVDSNGTATPSSREYITFTGTSGSTVIVETRNADSSSSAKTHAVGSIVEFIPDAVWAQRIIDQFIVEHSIAGAHTVSALVSAVTPGTSGNLLTSDGSSWVSQAPGAIDSGLDIAQIATPSSPSSGRNKLYFKSGDKAYTLTSGGTEAALATETYVGTLISSDGWVSAAESWSYASSTTITVPSGAASKYAIGDKIKLTQTTVKYFVVTAVADTVLTVFGGTDYTVANAAISLNYYSHAANPIGFPHWFNYTITVTAPGGTAPTFTGTNICRVTMQGRLVRMTYQLENSSGGTAGSGSVDVVLSLPIAAAQTNNSPMGMSMWFNSTAQAFLLTQIASSTTFKMKKIATTFLQAVDLNNASRFVYGELTYEA